MIAAKGTERAGGQVGDGFINTAPDPEPIKAFEAAGGRGKPKYGQLTVCWAATEAEAKETAHRVWPNGGRGPLSTELSLPSHFEEAQMVSPDDVARDVVCGPDAQRHIEQIQVIRRRRVQPRLRPPGGARPGGLLPLLPALPGFR